MTRIGAITLSLDRSESRSLATQIADSVRTAIHSGTLRPGTRVPSTRAVAAELGVARGVVDQAYDQLVAEGWLDARRGSGTYVTDTVLTPLVDRARRTPPPPPSTHLTRLRPGVPWTSPTVSAAWRRAWRTAGIAPTPHAYPDPAGSVQLRDAVADLLARARGMNVDPSRIVITTGATHGLSLGLKAIAPSITEPTLAVENPGYRVAAAAARAAGWTVLDVPVDSRGLDVDQLTDHTTGAHAVYVTPSHQYPTGGTLELPRRATLIDHVRRTGAYVMEDDYDSEFRYDVAPLPAMAQLAPDRVVYLGTVAKTLGAGIRLGWMVLPDALVEPVLAHRAAVGDFPSEPVGIAMLELLRDGEWDRTVRTARRRYRERDALVQDSLSEYGELRGLGAGMHTTLILSPARADAVANDALAHGVEVPTVAESVRSPIPLGGLVIGYGRIELPDLTRALAVLARALDRNP